MAADHDLVLVGLVKMRLGDAAGAALDGNATGCSAPGAGIGSPGRMV
jgi:hypothetical protein